MIAIVDGAGTLVERVSYDAYGEARHHWLLDVDGDGDVDAADNTTAVAANNKQIYQSGYNVHADFNRDGQVNRTDTDLVVSGNYASALGPGVISASAIDNIFGYCGYVHNPEAFVYTVRFRHYDPSSSGGVGRWMIRDPNGYADGENLYLYGGGDPVNGLDPTGLCFSTQKGEVNMKDSPTEGPPVGWTDGGSALAQEVLMLLDQIASLASSSAPEPASGQDSNLSSGGYTKKKGCKGCYRPPGFGIGLQLSGIGPDDPEWHKWKALIGEVKGIGITDYGWMFDWGVFWEEAWNQVLEHKWDILMTAVPGGVVLKALRVGLELVVGQLFDAVADPVGESIARSGVTRLLRRRPVLVVAARPVH